MDTDLFCSLVNLIKSTVDDTRANAEFENGWKIKNP